MKELLEGFLSKLETESMPKEGEYLGEGGLLYCDPALGIQWPEAGDVLLSDKDKVYPTLEDLDFSFKNL